MQNNIEQKAGITSLWQGFCLLKVQNEKNGFLRVLIEKSGFNKAILKEFLIVLSENAS
jgi:hypothetical protein